MARDPKRMAAKDITELTVRVWRNENGGIMCAANCRGKEGTELYYSGAGFDNMAMALEDTARNLRGKP